VFGQPRDGSGEMAGDGWTNDAESQINVVDCLLRALTDEVMLYSTRIQT